MEETKFGERLKKLRKEANLTQNDFADKLLVHSQTVSRWERGIIEPDISQLGEIAAAFRISLEKLLDLPESEKTYEGAFEPVSFGKTLCEKRIQKGESQEQLADVLSAHNVSPDTVSRWERGVTCPDIPQLAALSKHFGCPVSELYCGMGETEKSESESVVYVKKHKRAWKMTAAAAAVACLLTGAGAAVMITSAQKADVVYAVSFDGETVNVSSAQSYMPETPQRAGYDFCGWVNAGGEEVRFPRTLTGNEEYFSVFTPHEYYIDYWLNGGTFTEETQSSFTVESGEIPLNTPHKTGAAFEGWYAAPDYSGEAVASVQCGCADIKLYAKWSDAVYTVRYELYGGTMYDTNPDTVTAQEEIPLFSPVKKGHKFVGWFDAQPDGNERSENAANRITTVGGKKARNLTLYAVWQKTDEKYAITYDCRGGTMPYGNPETLLAGETRTLNAAEKFGYEFVGWNDLPDGSGVTYEKLYHLQADLKLYAIFRAKTYLIRYEYTGAYENEKTNPNYISFEDTAELYPVKKRGYEFTGWFTEKTGGVKVETIDSNNVASLSVLYARFAPITYTLKLDADGGNIVFSANENADAEIITYEYYLTVESASFYLPSCKKAGYDFVGWQDKESGETLDKIDSLDVKNRTLTAIWRESEKTYKITYVLGISGAENPNPAEAKCKNTLYLAEAEAGGYDFLGWYDNAEGNGAAITKIGKGNESDITLYALWQEMKTFGSTEFFDYEETSAGVTITNYKGNSGSNVTVNVPAYINGSPVVALRCKFGAGNGYIAEYNGINIPDGTVILGDRVFAYCRLNNALKIPAGAREIGSNCFALFQGDVYFDENCTIETIGSGAFHDCEAQGVLVLPKTVKNIDTHAFLGADFTGVVLPYGLETIGKCAFDTSSKCVVFLPETVKYLGEKACGDFAYTSFTAEEVKGVAGAAYLSANLQCGVKKGVVTLIDGESVVTTQEDYAFLLPTCRKEGYRFIGWADEEKNIANEYYVPCGNKTLRAVYISISETDGLSEATPMTADPSLEYEVYISSEADCYFVPNTEKAVKINIEITFLDISPYENRSYAPKIYAGENALDGPYDYTLGTVIKIGGVEKYRPPYRIRFKVTVLS